MYSFINYYMKGRKKISKKVSIRNRVTNNIAFSIFFWGESVLLLGYYYTHGMVMFDERYILNSGYRVLQGEVHYRDFHFVYALLSAFITTSGFFFLEKVFLMSTLLHLKYLLLPVFCFTILRGLRLSQKY